MAVTTLIIFLVLDVVWIAYAMIKAPIVEEEDFYQPTNDNNIE